MNCPKCSGALQWKEGETEAKQSQYCVQKVTVSLPHLWCQECKDWAYPKERALAARRWAHRQWRAERQLPSPQAFRAARYWSGFSGPDFAKLLELNYNVYRMVEYERSISDNVLTHLYVGLEGLANKLSSMQEWLW